MLSSDNILQWQVTISHQISIWTLAAAVDRFVWTGGLPTEWHFSHAHPAATLLNSLRQAEHDTVGFRERVPRNVPQTRARLDKGKGSRHPVVLSFIGLHGMCNMRLSPSLSEPVPLQSPPALCSSPSWSIFATLDPPSTHLPAYPA